MEHRRARTYFYRACDSGQKAGFRQAARAVGKGDRRKIPNDGDVLIALYHLPDQTPEQQAKDAWS